MDEAGFVVVGEQDIEFFVDLFHVSHGFGGQQSGFANIFPKRVVDAVEELRPVVGHFLVSDAAIFSGVFVVDGDAEFGKFFLEGVVFAVGALGFDFVKIFAGDIFQEDPGIGFVEVGEVFGEDDGARDAEFLEFFELVGFADKLAVDAMGRDFQYRPKTVGGGQEKGRVDGASGKRLHFIKLRGRPCPLFEDPPQNLPGDIILQQGHMEIIVQGKSRDGKGKMRKMRRFFYVGERGENKMAARKKGVCPCGLAEEETRS